MMFHRHSSLWLPIHGVTNAINVTKPLTMSFTLTEGYINPAVDDHLINAISETPVGYYKFSRDMPLVKTRGWFITDRGTRTQVEVVHLRTGGNLTEPIIIRVWFDGGPQGVEYLVSDTVLRLRSHLYQANVDTSGMLYHLSEALLSTGTSGLPDPYDAAALGIFTAAPVPNLSLGYHQSLLAQVNFELGSCADSRDVTELLMKRAFSPMTSKDMVRLVGYASGQLTSSVLSNQGPSNPRFDGGVATYGEISDLTQYFAIQELGFSFLDYFQAVIDRHGRINVTEVGHTSEMYDQYDQRHIEHLERMLTHYLDVTVSYTDQVGGLRWLVYEGEQYCIEQVTFERSMDDTLSVTYLVKPYPDSPEADQRVLVINYDLILLAVISPVIHMVPSLTTGGYRLPF